MLEIWMTLTFFGMALTSYERGRVDPLKGAIAFAVASTVLVCGAITYILLLRRMKQKIIEGQFRHGGGGFWGKSPKAIKLKVIVIIASSVIMAIYPVAIVIGKLTRGVVWNYDYAPVAAFIIPLFTYGVFFLFGYLNAICIIRKYYVKRFGAPELPEPLKKEINKK